VTDRAATERGCGCLVILVAALVGVVLLAWLARLIVDALT